jgi:hypothetical protein
MEEFDYLDELLASQFDDAPRQLKAIIRLTFRAVREGQFGEALNQLRQAQTLVDSKTNDLADWRAEVAAMWALYYLHGGPELELNDMWHKIALAQRLEPENRRLVEVIDLIKAQRGR